MKRLLQDGPLGFLLIVGSVLVLGFWGETLVALL